MYSTSYLCLCIVQIISAAPDNTSVFEVNTPRSNKHVTSAPLDHTVHRSNMEGQRSVAIDQRSNGKGQASDAISLAKKTTSLKKTNGQSVTRTDKELLQLVTGNTDRKRKGKVAMDRQQEGRATVDRLQEERATVDRQQTQANRKLNGSVRVDGKPSGMAGTVGRMGKQQQQQQQRQLTGETSETRQLTGETRQKSKQSTDVSHRLKLTRHTPAYKLQDKAADKLQDKVLDKAADKLRDRVADKRQKVRNASSAQTVMKQSTHKQTIKSSTATMVTAAGIGPTASSGGTKASGSAPGGAKTGGSASGGAGTGGSAPEGAATGGSARGGARTGGSVPGGAKASGSAPGGAGTGGSAAGGAGTGGSAAGARVDRSAGSDYREKSTLIEREVRHTVEQQVQQCENMKYNIQQDTALQTIQQQQDTALQTVSFYKLISEFLINVSIPVCHLTAFVLSTISSGNNTFSA